MLTKGTEQLKSCLKIIHIMSCQPQVSAESEPFQEAKLLGRTSPVLRVPPSCRIDPGPYCKTYFSFCMDTFTSFLL